MQQVETYGLTTVRAVVRLLGSGDEGEARRVLQSLRDQERLFRHHPYGDSQPIEHWTVDRRPLREQEIREKHTVLAFAAYTHQQRPVLDPARFKHVMGKVAAIANIGDVPFRPCYLHRANVKQPERVSLIRVGQTPDLQAVIEEIDQFADSPAFKPWYYLAMGNMFVLSYLLPAPTESVNELARWARRRPVICRIGAKPVPVPVYVYQAKIPA